MMDMFSEVFDENLVTAIEVAWLKLDKEAAADRFVSRPTKLNGLFLIEANIELSKVASRKTAISHRLASLMMRHGRELNHR